MGIKTGCGSNPMHINGSVRSISITFGIDRMVGKGWDGVETGATISSRIWGSMAADMLRQLLILVSVNPENIWV